MCRVAKRARRHREPLGRSPRSRQVLLLVADAIDSLSAVLFKKLPFAAAQAASLRLPLDVAAALGDTEEERAVADVLASH